MNAETNPHQSILDQYLGEPTPRVRRGERASRADTGDLDGDAASIGDGHVAMLTLVHASGNRVALPYSMLMKAEFNPSVGITLRFSTDDVTISGHRLDDLFRAITQHRAREVKELGSNAEFSMTGREPMVVTISLQAAA